MLGQGPLVTQLVADAGLPRSGIFFYFYSPELPWLLSRFSALIKIRPSFELPQLSVFVDPGFANIVTKKSGAAGNDDPQLNRGCNCSFNKLTQLKNLFAPDFLQSRKCWHHICVWPCTMQQKFYFFMPIAMLACVGLAKADSLVLDWSASVSPNVAGYDVYYGTTSGVYSYQIDAGNATSVTIPNLMPGMTYYFVANAYDVEGDHSLFSSEISYTVPGVPGDATGTAPALTVVPGANPGSPLSMQFPAQLGHWYEIQASTDLQSWTSIWQSEIADSNVVMQFVDPNAAFFMSRFYRLVIH
jgi:hypothetical protein